MTEEEARSKWCPQARTYDEGSVAPVTLNRDFDGDIFNSCNCIASDCMMWVEEKSVFKDGETSCAEDEVNRRFSAGEFTFVGGHCGLVK